MSPESVYTSTSPRSVRRISRTTFMRSGLGLVGMAALAACAQPPAATPQVVDRVVTQIVEVEKPVDREVVVTQIVEMPVTQVVDREVEVTRVVEQEVEVEVTRVVEQEVEVEVTRVVEAPLGEVKETLHMYHFQAFYMAPITPVIAAKTGIALIADSISGDYWGTLTAQLAAGQGGDIILLDVNNWGGFFKMGVLDDFDPIAKSAGVDYANFYHDPLQENGYEGQLMGLSYAIPSNLGLWFDADEADRLGFASELPTWDSGNYDTWTMQQLLDFLRQITVKNSDGTTDIYSWDTGTEWGWWEVHKHLMFSNGGGWFPELGDYEPAALTVNSPESVEALQAIVDAARDGTVVPWSVYETGSSKGGDWVYLAKKALSWTFNLQSRDNLEPYFGKRQYFIALPGFKAKTSSYQYRLWGLNKNGTKKDEAAQVIIQTNTDDQDIALIKALQDYLPAYDPAGVINLMPEGERKFLAMHDLARRAGMTTKPEVAEGVELFPASTGLNSGWTGDFMTAYRDAMEGTAGLQEGLDAVVAKWNAEFAKGYN